MFFEEESKCTVLLVLVGSFVLIRFILSHMSGLLGIAYVLYFSRSVDFKWYGKWAVVTGATDGIGKAYSGQLAQKGMSIVLVSRSMEKLEKLAEELREKYKVDVKIIMADFSRREIYEHISTELEELEIGMLVNNVGIAYPQFLHFHELSSQVVDTMVQVNTLSLVGMTRIVLPKMLDRGRGIIINVGSMLGDLNIPLFAQYCASKAFVSSFTRCIQYEYKYKPDVIIQYLAPGSVSTKMQHHRTPTSTNPIASVYVQSAMKTIGRLSQTQGYFPHKLLALVTDIFPRVSVEYLILRLTKKINSIEVGLASSKN